MPAEVNFSETLSKVFCRKGAKFFCQVRKGIFKLFVNFVALYDKKTNV